jgi:metallo-beta-lactamase family protein
MHIHLCGAAGEVTGSGYLIRTERASVLVDFGMFQGQDGTFERNSQLGAVQPSQLDAVVLTHGHLDHCGRLPLLSANRRFRAAVHATPATCDMASLVLLDSAHIQESDAEQLTRRRQRRGLPAAVPLYHREDVERLQSRFDPLPYEEARTIAPGVTARLVEAGHMLGSASVILTVRDGDRSHEVVFSGDLGPRGLPFLRDPARINARPDVLFLESTYGDRDHKPMAATLDEFRSILIDAYQGRQRVLIPSFAIGRAQQILYYLAEFFRDGSVPKIPVYLDTPMGVDATRLYTRHQDLFDAEAGLLTRNRQLERDLSMLEFVETAAESKALNNLRDAAVIIAASGMCEGGRILHHLKHNLWRKYVHVVFVGYQAQGTLGRRLVDGAKLVRIMGEEVAVGAKVHTLNGFSAHAGQTELLDWAAPMATGQTRILLTHGEDGPRAALQAKIRERFGIEAERPDRGATVEV